MSAIFSLLSLLVFLFFVVLIGRLVLEWIQVFARDWRPKGPVLVVAEVVYSITDPPLQALRRVIKPVRIGQIQLDLAFMVLAFACILLMRIFDSLAVA